MTPKHAPVFSKPRQKAGGFVTVLQQRPLIEAVLRVANLERPTDPDSIYELLDPFAAGGSCARLRETGPEAAAILWRDIEGHGDTGDVSGVGVRGVLDRIVRSLNAARRDYSDAIEAAMQRARVELVATPHLIADRLEVNLRIRGYGCQSIESVALALLLDSTARIDKSRTFGEALRRCAYPECEKFFLSYTTKAGGRPPNYHDAECKRLHNKLMRAVRESK